MLHYVRSIPSINDFYRVNSPPLLHCVRSIPSINVFLPCSFIYIYTLYMTSHTALDPLTSLEVSCVAGEDSCYLEASCVPSQTGLVSGCRLDYMSSAGSESRYATPLSISSRIAEVSCDNQTMISYTGRAYDSMLRALRCPRSGMTKCPLMRGNVSIFFEAAFSD